jgi:hypothetical protein
MMCMRWLQGILVCAVLAVGLIPITAQPAPASACLSGHGGVLLAGFPADVGSLFYAALEGQATNATVRVTPGCFHLGEIARVQAQYRADPGTATADDYNVPPGQTPTICADIDSVPEACGDPPHWLVSLPMNTDVASEDAVERFTFRLTGRVLIPGSTGAFGPPLSIPSAASVYVIDTNGAPRVTLEPGVSYSRSESYPVIRIPVFFAGGAGAAPFTVQPGAQNPATPGEDFQVVGSSVSPAAGVGYITINIMNDKLGEGPETLTISLNGGVQQASTTLTIEDNEESNKPSSRFHHPRQGWRYKKSDYRIREVHIFTQDNPGGSGVTATQFALRRNMKNKDCFWLTRGGWKKQDCNNREWLGTQWDPIGELWRYRLKQLKSSVGTKIKDYTAFGRAIDGAGNVESDFVKKRNANTFEIKRSRRR